MQNRKRKLDSLRAIFEQSEGEKHWHGAAPTTAMTHIAIQEQLDGKSADWMEKVSDDNIRPD